MRKHSVEIKAVAVESSCKGCLDVCESFIHLFIDATCCNPTIFFPSLCKLDQPRGVNCFCFYASSV